MSFPTIDSLKENVHGLFYKMDHLAHEIPTLSALHIYEKTLPSLLQTQEELNELKTELDVAWLITVHDQESEKGFAELRSTLNKTIGIWNQCFENITSKKKREREITESPSAKVPKTEEQDHLSYLPGDLLRSILENLSPKDFFNLSQVSKGFQHFCNQVWQSVLSTQTGVILTSKDDYLQQIRMSVLFDRISKGIYTTRKLTGHSSNIDVLFKDGSFLYSSSVDNMIKIWDLTTETCIATLQNEQSSVMYSYKGKNFLLSRASANLIRIWDLKTGNCRSALLKPQHDKECQFIEGNFLYHCPKAGARIGDINIWDRTTIERVASIPLFSTSFGHVNNLFKEGGVIYCSYANPASANKDIIILDFRTSYSDLLKAADAILQQGDLSHFLAFGEKCKHAIHEELAAIEARALDFSQQFAITENKKKAQAIYHFVAKQIIYFFENGSNRQALVLFKQLPEEMKQPIYKELEKIGESNPEQAFLNSQDMTNGKRKIAIHNYLNQRSRLSLIEAKID